MSGFYCRSCTLMKASDLTEQAFEIAVDKTSFYDLLFLAATEQEDMPLLTLDKDYYMREQKQKEIFA